MLPNTGRIRLKMQDVDATGGGSMITVTIKCSHDLQPMRANRAGETWNQGAEGKQLVTNILEQLGPDYAVLHDVTLPRERGNIDHIVIGENGILVIETKN